VTIQIDFEETGYGKGMHRVTWNENVLLEGKKGGDTESEGGLELLGK